MKEFFTDLYNKVLEFFQQEKEEAENSKEIAQNRLKLVLMHDRAKLDAVTMEKMRLELIKVISKYVEIDEDALDLNLDGDGQAVALMVNIPVIRTKDPEEIEAEEKAAKEAEEIEETSDEENATEEENTDETTSEEVKEDDETSSEETDEDNSNEEETSEEEETETEEVKSENNEETVLEEEPVEKKTEKTSKKKNN